MTDASTNPPLGTKNDRKEMHNALTLSEIRSHIGIFLISRNSDLIACMRVCKAWRPDFRRLLYLSLVLPKRTLGPILSPSQWRAYSSYTQTLAIEEPAMIHRGSSRPANNNRYNNTNSNSRDQASLRSPDYNMDPVVHCPNLLHLAVKLNPKLLPLCCWTRQDDYFEVVEGGIIAGEEDVQHWDQRSLFKTSAVVRYDRQQDSFLVKTSNRILALLHHHPQLQTFHWSGVSDTHMDQLGRYLVTREHRLVELKLECLKASVPELNRIIANCPRLRRLHLKTLILEARPSWPELDTIAASESASGSTSGSALSVAAFSRVLAAPSGTASSTPSSNLNSVQQDLNQQQQPVILDLRLIDTLTLEEPCFPLMRLCIHGPAVQQLNLVHCKFPAGFNTAVGTNSAQEPASSTPDFGVYWNCPQLESYKHEKESLIPSLFARNLMDSSKSTLTSLSLVSYIMEPDFVSELLAHDRCRILTHLDLRYSTWIKSTDIQLLLCHCPELVDFTGPQGVLWGEDLLTSGLSWACVKLKRLQLLVCLARPDSGLWEQSIDRPLGFPLQRILGPNVRFSIPQQYQVAPDAPDTPSEQPSENQEISSASSIQLQDIQDAIYEQLAQLTELEFVDLTGGGSSSFHFLVEYPRGIPWTLEAGLFKLRSLVRMRELIVTGWEDKMTRREVQWFKKHWPELRSIVNESGNLTQGGHGQSEGQGTAAAVNQGESETKPDEKKVVGWLAFEICLSQEWPERFPRAIGLSLGGPGLL